MNAPETNINQQIAADYDNTPYKSHAFYYSSPGHIRAAAQLYNIEAPPLERARVLELGCAAGGNLLPFALAYPHSTVVGVDLSQVQVGHGERVLRDLNVPNMRLHAMSLTDITPDFGEFDYIVVHGVFSWVPAEVKQAILRICRENLAPQGIAYVSYNTYPGWKGGDIVRDAMLLHSHGATTDGEKVARAKAMMGLLSEGLSPKNALASSLRPVVEWLSKQSDYYVIHEYLAAVNTPCYFVEFADAAMQAGLAYVGDAEPHVEIPASYGRNVQLYHGVVALGQPKLMRQQYLDFAVGRTFRKSLLVHAERQNDIAVTPEMDQLSRLRFGGCFTRVDEKEAAGTDARVYSNSVGQRLQTSEPLVEALMAALTQAWPASMTGEQLASVIRDAAAVQAPTRNAEEVVAETMGTLFRTGTVRISAGPVPYDLRDTGHLEILPGIAYLTERNREKGFVVGIANFWHENLGVNLTPAERYLLDHFNGERSGTKLRALLSKALQDGIVPDDVGSLRTGQRNMEPLAQRIVNTLIDKLQRLGLVSGRL
ncbi:methyltransferase regulatory domain-containing protein [Bordetella bronchialis]|uniref:methyltransferase regulatory domain-containing protein n=1 Tax=Bordetella bronchialis TaxID=463025 RepID=UPI003D03A6D5